MVSESQRQILLSTVGALADTGLMLDWINGAAVQGRADAAERKVRSGI